MASDILVTGASGFIGTALVAELLASGVPAARLRCLVRDRGRALARGLPESSLFQGSLDDTESLRRAARGVGVTFHVAGLTRALSRRELDAVNAEGTRRLVDALLHEAPGSRLVHVSSVAAAGPSRDGRGTAAPPEQCRPCSHYGRSKLAGEHHVVAAGDRLVWNVVRPPIVYGPTDAGTRLLFRQACAPIAVVPWRARPLSLIHVRDLARLLRLAATAGAGGFLPADGPDRLDTDSLVTAIAAACGRRARPVRVPMIVPRAVAPLADLWFRAVRSPSFFNSDKMREASADGWVADPAPARTALGFEPEIPTAVGFAEVAKCEGFLAASRAARAAGA